MALIRPLAVFLTLLLLTFLAARSQSTSTLQPGDRMPIDSGWKFHPGDSVEWAHPDYDDASWVPIRIGAPWETQGYPDLDGYGWYRLHIVIPSSVKEQGMPKERLQFDLGRIDDADQVFLNGSMIGANAGKGDDMNSGNASLQRSYSLPLDDPRIHWDSVNVIAVRVLDYAGGGGMSGGVYGMGMKPLLSYVTLDAQKNVFSIHNDSVLSKTFTLSSSSELYRFNGTLTIQFFDPETDRVIYRNSTPVVFDKQNLLRYHYTVTIPTIKSYRVEYVFRDQHSADSVLVKEESPYILTPVSPSVPRINGADVYGASAGAPFLYRIPATGQEPLVYSAQGLPDGLHLDSQTGIITGSLKADSNYPVLLQVKNDRGTATRTLTIIGGRLIGLTPPIGWNSYASYYHVSDSLVRMNAKVLSSRLASHGWSYVNIDEGWSGPRDANGEVHGNERFPDMKALGDYIHGFGLKFGIYSSPGPQTCGGLTGSYQHEDQDALTFARWGVDLLKYDYCSYSNIAPKDPTVDDYKKPYDLMRQSLDKTGRDIFYALCQYGLGDSWKWGAAIGANSWRNTGDIWDGWAGVVANGFSQYKYAPYTQPGHYNDPDCLIPGQIVLSDWSAPTHPTSLTPDEQYSQMSLWCLISAPLLAGCDLTRLDEFTLALLTNDEVLAISQDSLVRPAVKMLDDGDYQVWTKQLKDGSFAVGVFNMMDDSHPIRVTLRWRSLRLPKTLLVRDCWRQQDLGVFTRKLKMMVPRHGVKLLIVRNPALHR